MTTLNDLVEQFNAGQINPMQEISIKDGENSWLISIKKVENNTELDRYRNREFEQIGDTWFLDAARIKFKTLINVTPDGDFVAKENILISDKSQYHGNGVKRLSKGALFSRSSIRDDYLEMVVEQRRGDYLLDVDSQTSL